MSKQTFIKASSILLILFVASRVLGFVREQVIAALLGTSAQSDAFVVAATIPFTFSYILGVSAGNAFLPIYTGRLQDQNRARMASTVFYFTGALVSVLTLLGLIFTPRVVDLLAPGFTGEARRLALLCTRIMLPSTIFLTIGFLAKAALNAHREFTVPALAPVWQNVIFLVMIIPLAKYMGPGLAWCTLAGALVFYVYNLPAMRRFGIPLRPLVDLKDPDARRVLQLAVPVILTTLAARGFVFVDRWFGSHLAEGSIAALNFANRVRELPYGMFTAAVSSVLFPALAAAAGRRDMQSLRDRTAMGLRLVALVTYPGSVLLMVLAVPVVRLLFERGAFDASATTATATALWFYALSVAAMSANSVLTYTFLSLRDAMLPLWAGLAGLAVNIGLDYLLVGRMQHAGLALGNTAGFFVTVVFFLVFLPGRLPGFDWRRQATDQLKIIVATLVFALVLRLAGGYAGLFAPGLSLAGQLLGMTLAVGAAGIVYLLVLVLLKVEEVDAIRQRFIK
ncbi:murein biosynthesis integral membrane protein MurJ [Desulfallas sp. Bu1-1]|uniref:murein biosynthesis integral membrane protein MurJ n=1 Tax=Desulfallas sp. Bu1-1 TaxID=2787620 RepID=UPI0024351F95|nr:murein biosynthesis integral membrane protein MurJ [Desulfallas sp. Bu1-1]